MKLRSLIVAVLWVGALSLIVYSVGARRSPAAPTEAWFPEVGDRISVDSVRQAFGVDPAGGDAWLLVVTSSCPGCLQLDAELTFLKEAASCAGARLVALIVELDAGPTGGKRKGETVG